jgi:uncharacterized membrane protein
MRSRRLTGKQRGQVALITPIAVIACIGILGLILDIGIFRLIDSELENAADAAALAAAWYDPVCPVLDSRCATDNTAGFATPKAREMAKHNLHVAAALCGDDPPNKDANIQVQTSNQIHNPSAPAVSVIISCKAPYLAGAVLRLSGDSQIIRWATAAIGDKQPDGSLGNYTLGGSALIAALISL